MFTSELKTGIIAATEQNIDFNLKFMVAFCELTQIFRGRHELNMRNVGARMHPLQCRCMNCKMYSLTQLNLCY